MPLIKRGREIWYITWKRCFIFLDQRSDRRTKVRLIAPSTQTRCSVPIKRIRIRQAHMLHLVLTAIVIVIITPLQPVWSFSFHFFWADIITPFHLQPLQRCQTLETVANMITLHPSTSDKLLLQESRTQQGSHNGSGGCTSWGGRRTKYGIISRKKVVSIGSSGSSGAEPIITRFSWDNVTPGWKT